MAKASSSLILQTIRSMVEDQEVKELADHELLGRFVAEHDEAAFRALLRRHGPVVLDVCRSMLANQADAEDAFQATFLVFARKARGIREASSLGSWLYGVAYRIALKAQAEFARRKKHESRAPTRAFVESADDLTWRDIKAVIHRELNSLPERFRTVLVLCYLEGRTQDEAAQQLKLPKGTLKGRLERGRALLRERLSGADSDPQPPSSHRHGRRRRRQRCHPP
jgi:RNA polymerase sigma factor (sigma-70 family)